MIATIDPVRVGPRTKCFGGIEIVNSLGGNVYLPVGVIHGGQPGPTVLITAGLFAREYCGIDAAAQLYQSLDPDALRGRVIVVPVVNMPALQFRTPWLELARSLTPADGLNVNTLFPGSLPDSDVPVVYRQSATAGGDPSGSVSRKLAYHLFHDLLLHSDYHIDLRGGDLDESHLAHTVFLRMGKPIDDTCEQMARVFGAEYVLPGTPEIGHTSPGTLIYEAVACGIPSIISESGLGYRQQPLEENVARHVDGVINLLKYWDMTPGEPLEPVAQRYLGMVWNWIPAPVAGFFHAGVDQGDIVERGQVLGKITDIDGTELRRIISPIDGIVHCMFPRRFVLPGDDVYTLLELGEPTGS